VGQVALATFQNNGGLVRLGSTLFRETVNSGAAQVGTAGSAQRGTIQGGTLEASNVDLADQFTKLIIAERGFQANSRIMTTSDEILQELVNLKR
ncbi:MAG TPA: flagellar hook-basal body complex protein, partial [Armatimonadota bacterium]|nr:flagellar hook-basal body complex protein [Armatimonadota bacterium]